MTNKINLTNIHLQSANPLFQLTHQKTFIFDDKKALVMTFNLTRSSFTHERNFALMIDSPAMVNEISQVFNADWQRKSISPHEDNLIWSPNNSRQKLLTALRSAKSTIKIYAQELSDYETIGELAKAARAGIKVEILLSTKPTPGKWNYLTNAGVQIHVSHHYLIHAKVIMLDHAEAILGSMNLTQPSMEKNRELSVITRDKNILQQLENTFDKDW